MKKVLVISLVSIERGNMNTNITFDYFYNNEQEKFIFYRIPKLLISDPAFGELCIEAKFLYGLLLDKTSLSKKNGWIDNQNRVYIKYTIEDIMKDMNCANQKACKLLKQLEDFHLIERVRRGQGKASLIYVKNFSSCQSFSSEKTEENVENTQRCENHISENIERCENHISKNEKNTFQEMPKSHANNNNNINNNDCNKNHSIYPSKINNNNMMDDTMDETTYYMDFIKENISLDIMCQREEFADRYMELYHIICDVVCVPRKTIRIGKEDYPYALVKNQFLRLKHYHLEYVIEQFENVMEDISNPKQYLITCLYNAPSTYKNAVTQMVTKDLKDIGY